MRLKQMFKLAVGAWIIYNTAEWMTRVIEEEA